MLRLSVLPHTFNLHVVKEGKDVGTHLVVHGDRKSTTSELQSHSDLVCRLLLEKKKKKNNNEIQKKKKIRK